MILRTIYKPSQFWPAAALTSGIEGQTQVPSNVIYMDDVFVSEAAANAAFPNVSGHWDPMGVGDTWDDWSVDSACIMEAFERAAQESKYWEKGYAYGVLEFDPGVYHVSMGHVWFYSAVNLKGLEHCRFDGCMNDKSIFSNMGTNPTWYGTDAARAVLTIGHDSNHRSTLADGSTVKGWNNITASLPVLNNYENIYASGLHASTGAGLRILSFYLMTLKNVTVSGPFKYGIIFNSHSAGSAYLHMELGYIHDCLTALKWRHKEFCNACFISKGLFTHREGGAIVQTPYNPYTYPSVVLDADNTNQNPNQTYETGFWLPAQWEFSNCGFETASYNQFIRGSGLNSWKFQNIRWEAYDRPSLGPPVSGITGNWTVKKHEWFVPDINHCAIDGGTSTFMLAGIPSGVLGRGINIFNTSYAPVGYSNRNITHGPNKSKQPLYNFGEQVIDGRQGGLVLDNYVGDRRYRVQLADTPFSSNNDYQLIAVPLPKAAFTWRIAGTSDAFGTSSVYIPFGSGIQIHNACTNYTAATVYIRLKDPTSYGFGNSAYDVNTSTWDSSGNATLTPIASGWHEIYGSCYKSNPDGSSNYESGGDWIDYAFAVRVSGVS